MDTWDSSTSATTGLVDEPMVQSQLYSSGAKAVPCAAVTACHDKAKVWYLCYTVVSLPMECWLKKASLKYCRHWVWQQSSITIIFSTVHCLERGLPRQLTRDPVISWQGISAVRVEKQGWGLSKCIRTYNKVAFDTKIPLLFWHSLLAYMLISVKNIHKFWIYFVMSGNLLYYASTVPTTVPCSFIPCSSNLTPMQVIDRDFIWMHSTCSITRGMKENTPIK